MCFVSASQRLLNKAYSIGVEVGNIIIDEYYFLGLPLTVGEALRSQVFNSYKGAAI